MNRFTVFLVFAFFLFNFSATLFVKANEKLIELKAKPVALQDLVPKMDKEHKAFSLKADIRRDVYDNETIPVITSSWKIDYTAGRRLYQRGDYKNAALAFKTALMEMDGLPKNDPRYKMTAKAFEMANSLMSERGKLGYETSSKGKNGLTGHVTKVFSPSLAWLSGLKKGDYILKAKAENGVYKLTVKRQGKLRTLNLKAENPAFAPRRHSRLKARAKKSTLKASATKKFPKSEKILEDYDCCLLVDCSGSMNTNMAPGTNYSDMTRWQWCGQQSYDFMANARKYLPKGITVVPFNSNFSIKDHVGLNDISDLYNTVKPFGGTVIENPLSYVLTRYYKKRDRGYTKPLSVTILTDGIAHMRNIGNVIITATQGMKSKREIVITFLEVDEAYKGEQILNSLDNNLVNAGAKYDIVHVRSFHQLMNAGLKESIVSTLIEAQGTY